MDLTEQLRRTWNTDPESPSLEFKRTSYVHAEFAALAAEFENILVKAGVPQDAPINLVSRNRPLHAAIMLAAVYNRRSLTSLYAMQAADKLAGDVETIRPSVLVADAQDWGDELKNAAHNVGALGVSLDLDASPQIAVVSGLGRVSEGSHQPPFEEPGFEILSSGTTGPPKRILLTLKRMARLVDMVRLTIPPGGDASPVLMMFPLTGIGGVGGLIPNLILGRYVVLFEKFNLADWMEAVERLKPTSFVVPPTVMRMMLDAKIPREALSSMKYVFGGGARLAPELQDEFEEAYGVKVLWAYGCTEFCGSLAAWTPDQYDQYCDAKRGSAGQVVRGVQTRTVDPESGAILPQGTEGYLEVLMPEISKDWFRTTDIVRIDEDGFLYHLGRGDGAIVRGGFKIQPQTIIETIGQHPLVMDVGVVGLPDDRLGQVPVAVVQASPGRERPTPSDLEAYARCHLLKHYVPACFIVVDDLPRTGTMKVDQRALMQLVMSSV